MSFTTLLTSSLQNTFKRLLDQLDMCSNFFIAERFKNVFAFTAVFCYDLIDILNIVFLSNMGNFFQMDCSYYIHLLFIYLFIFVIAYLIWIKFTSLVLHSYIYTHIWICTYIHISICIYTYTYINTHKYIYVCVSFLWHCLLYMKFMQIFSTALILFSILTFLPQCYYLFPNYPVMIIWITYLKLCTETQKIETYSICCAYGILSKKYPTIFFDLEDLRCGN